MAEFAECQSLNRLLVIERQDMKQRIEITMDRVSASSCSSFIKDKINEVKNCIKLLEKVDKSILSNIVKFESLDEFYITERDAANDYKIEIEEKIAVIAENLTKSSTPSPTSEVSVPPINYPPEGAMSSNGDRPVSNKFI